MSTIVFVTYRATSKSRFDRDYYLNNHLPLVATSWEKYGYEDSTALFPLNMSTDTIAICELRFRDDAALAASLASDEASAVMADIENYTNITAEFSRPTPL
ncbi:EthD family reductase [Sphingomonas sp. LB2R24]|uniref:EthD family reductase n=1 Tax=Sphingomonas sorbitolis TaxID=3096165 RepID=UPI002FCA7A7D